MPAKNSPAPRSGLSADGARMNAIHPLVAPLSGFHAECDEFGATGDSSRRNGVLRGVSPAL